MSSVADNLIRTGSPQAPEEVVRARGLSVHIADRLILSEIDLSVRCGQVFALLGHNGAGKTTLILTLATLIRPSGGSLLLFGREARPQAHLRARIGLIGHQPSLYRDLTVLENLELFARLHRVGRDRAAQLISELDLGGVARRRVATLSRGMIQRAAIARALVHSPVLLLADEPFTGLDPESAARLEELFALLASRGTAVVFSTHEPARALVLAPTAVVLREGRIAMQGETGSIAAAHHQATRRGAASAPATGGSGAAA
jgi:heme exporter protein A